MTATSAEIQWFIAREGKQYGPVSDAEMQKLAELRHLKPGDLFWRPGFPEWRPATTVFPQPQPMQPKLSTQPPPASASQTQHANAAPYETQPARAEPQRHEPQAAPRPAFGGAPYETHQPVNQPGAHPAAGRPVAGQSATGQSPTTPGQRHGQPAPAANVGQQPMHNTQFPMPRQHSIRAGRACSPARDKVRWDLSRGRRSLPTCREAPEWGREWLSRSSGRHMGPSR